MELRKWLFICLSLLIIGVGTLYIMRFHYFETAIPICGEFVDIEGKLIYTTIQGAGKPVLFLHGFPFHSDSFYEIATLPPEGYQFITMDFPGTGFAGKNDLGNISPADLALLVKLFLDKLNIKKVTIVGHDLGGGVAMIVGARYPNLVERLFLIAPDSSQGASSDHFGFWWRLPVLDILWATLRLDRTFIRNYLAACWYTDDENWNQFVERSYKPLKLKDGRKGFLEMLKQTSGFHYLPYEERLKMDCKLVWGRQDKIIPVEQAGKLSAILMHSELEIVENSGHLLQQEHPKILFDILKTFLKQPVRAVVEEEVK